MLTRTIWVSCLSHFLLLLLHLRQICNGLYRDRASARNQLCNRGYIRGSDQTCTATLVMLNKICTMTAKSAPYPPCTVTAFWLKYQDPARLLRRVTQPPHIAGPLYLSQFATDRETLKLQWPKYNYGILQTL